MQIGYQTRFTQVAPDQLRIREGGGCLSVFGLPFFMAGIFTILVVLGVIPLENESESPSWSWIILAAMGLIFTAVGGVLVFGRRWITLDIGRGTVVTCWGLIIPMKQTELSLDMYNAAMIRLKTGDSDSADTYSVALRAKDGSKDLDLYRSTQYGTSHEQAVLIADFLRLPIIDTSTDHETVIDSHLAERSYRSKIDEKKEEFTPAPRPAVLQTQVQESSASVEVIIPEKVFNPSKLIRYMMPSMILIFFVPQFVSFFRQTNTPDIVKYVFLVIAIFFLGIVPLIGLIIAIVRSRKCRTVVTASTEGIKIDYRGILRTKTRHIPIADILGLDYSTAETVWKSVRQSSSRQPKKDFSVDYESMGYIGRTPRWMRIFKKFVKSKGIIIKSRSGLITFGAGLPDEEVQYLFSLVKRVIVERRA